MLRQNKTENELYMQKKITGNAITTAGYDMSRIMLVLERSLDGFAQRFHLSNDEIADQTTIFFLRLSKQRHRRVIHLEHDVLIHFCLTKS